MKISLNSLPQSYRTPLAQSKSTSNKTNDINDTHVSYIIFNFDIDKWLQYQTQHWLKEKVIIVKVSGSRDHQIFVFFPSTSKWNPDQIDIHRFYSHQHNWKVKIFLLRLLWHYQKLRLKKSQKLQRNDWKVTVDGREWIEFSLQRMTSFWCKFKLLFV